ncbi:MAG: NUDIX domain-containing protein, partial [Solirubrobacterales bacterium]
PALAAPAACRRTGEELIDALVELHAVDWEEAGLEGFEEAALREVREETGLDCELGEELEPVSYIDEKGRPKLVRYWLMSVVGGQFEPNDEVDDLRWLVPSEATVLLSYPHDRELVESVTS